MKKVKDKVKKIEDTLHLKKHGHGDDQHSLDDDHDTSEEEKGGGYEEDEVENIQDPEVHGAPSAFLFLTSMHRKFEQSRIFV